MPLKRTITLPGLTGEHTDGFDMKALLSLLSNGEHEILEVGRHTIYKIDSPDGPVVLKQFGLQSALKDRLDRHRGSKAQRSFTSAWHLQTHQIGTPAPLAWFDRWEGTRLRQSSYISRFVPDLSSFKDELQRLWAEWPPRCEHFMALLQRVAIEVRRLHDAGVMHRDLGNQNISLIPDADVGFQPLFIDLNRARIYESLTPAQRGADLCRIALPSDLRRVFFQMVFAPDVVPPEFTRAEKRCRRRFAFHTRTRRLRHPIRYRKRSNEVPTYPLERDMWIWDGRSRQPIPALKGRDRLKHHPVRSHVKVGQTSLRHARAIERKALKLLSKLPLKPDDTFRAPDTGGESPKISSPPSSVKSGLILPTSPTAGHDPGLDSGESPHVFQESHASPVRHRVGLTLEASRPATEAAAEDQCLRQLGPLPLLLRIYHHESADQQQRALERLRELHDYGHPVAIAFCQDRRAILEPDSWKRLVDSTLQAVGDQIEFAEIGHAINRAKWGCWGIDEALQLSDPFCAFPELPCAGPSVIDFEPYYLHALLARLPRPLQALSHHLYVDRRGAPENLHRGKNLLHKLASLRAAAEHFETVENRIFITETNWPLAGTGAWSPVTSPYESPGPRRHDPNVSEEIYAHYMLRYLLHALGSGLADRVYWWTLGARGFGLADDSITPWRLRPAFHAFKQFLHRFGDARCLNMEMETGCHRVAIVSKNSAIAWDKSIDPTGAVFRFHTENPSAQIVYAVGENPSLADGVELHDLSGERLDTRQLSGRPAILTT